MRITNIFVHGLGQTADNWKKTISLMKNDNENLCPDLAEILGQKNVNYNNLYECFSDICNTSKEPLNLCGLSLGGILSLNYAIDNPNKINSLVLIATQYKMPKKLLKFQNLVFKIIPNSMFKQTGFKKKDFINLCSTMMNLDFSKLLSKVTCPVLVIYGEKDKSNKKASIELAGILKNSCIKSIKNSGHEVNNDAPKELAQIINSFYNKIV